MKRSGILVGLCLAVVLAIPQVVFAANPQVHFFDDCKMCHLTGYTVTQMSSMHVCLQCHDSFASDVTLGAGAPPTLDGHTDGRFDTGDASNAFGHNASPVKQTSHNWAASDNQPAAGAQAPTRSLYAGFYSRYGASHGKVTCSRCHNPHGEAASVVPEPTNNPKLLIPDIQNANLPMDPEKMCRACHVAYAAQDAGNHGLVGHPVPTADYATVVASQPTKYKTAAQVAAATGSSKAELIGGKVTCLSCHSVHYADSNSTTADGISNRGGLQTGDGLILKGDGLNFVNDPVRSTSFCNTCHVYATGFHSNKAGTVGIGCLGCHGGHNNSAQPSYYMLNSAYTTRPTTTAERSAMWGGTQAGVQDGFCESCHGNIESNFGGSLQNHTSASLGDCDTCHLSHSQGSFSKPVGCNDCHGFPPRDATGGGPNATGYAIDVAKGYNYSVPASNGGITYRNEATTAHATHAYGAGAGNYAYICDQCHQGNTHDDQVGFNPTFQDVFIDTTGLLATSQGFVPTYNKPAATCATVYCHSDGRSVRAGGATAKAVPNWAGGATTCTSCHNTGTTGTATVHNTHLALSGLSVTCDTCHTLTASNATTLKATATGEGGVHVDGTVTVDGAFNTFTPAAFNAPAGTCAVYCHSNGSNGSLVPYSYKQQPDWDDVTTGDCGDCHAVAAGNGLSGAHDRHLSLGFACNACHTHDGSAFGGNHINGSINLTADVCATCHGATVGVSAGPDRYPTWTVPASVDCETCHTGSAIATIGGNGGVGTYVDQSKFGTLGHGKTGVAKVCTDCHDAAAAGHFNGHNNPRLTGAATANDAFCKTCHAAKGSHYNNSATAGGTSTSADNCYVCHNAHGKGMPASNTDAMLLIGTGFTDKTNAASYWNASFTGVCQTCHDPADGTGGSIAHYNRTTADGHNSGQVCVSCHTHDATPAFAPGAGTSCDGCHGFPPNTAAHALHAPDSFALDGAGTVLDTADRTACAYCHTGANLYTYDPAADRASATAGRLNHGVGDANQKATLNSTVGYNITTFNCTSACHAMAAGQAAVWSASSLTCDSCHGNPPADGGGDSLAHSKHIAAGQTCATCHVSVPAAGDTTHISVKTGATELARVQNAAQALADEANVAVTTWNDTNNTCANTDCHNPSADSHLADWDTSTSTCNLCHGNTAGADSMATARHGKHVDNAAVIGDNIACTTCHPNAGSNMAHRNGTLQVNAGLNYTGELVIPNTAYGTCSSLNCHYDTSGKPGPDTPTSPAWDEVNTKGCEFCHKVPSDYGDHVAHFSAGRVSNGMACITCHANTVLSNTTIKPGGSHLNGSKIDVAYSGNYNGSAVSATYNSVPNPSSCTANCHMTGNPKVWEVVTTCEGCHGDLSSVGTTHTRHINITGSIDADLSECSICHGDVSGYTMGEGGNHQNGTTDLVAGISNTTCANACHTSTAGDGSWTDNNGLNCNACHGNPPAGNNHSKHIAAGMSCSACHGTVDAAGTHPLTHNHGKDIDSSGATSQAEDLQSRGNAALNPTGLDVAVNDAAYNGGAGTTWVNSAVTNDAGNTCANAVCHNPSSNGHKADWDVSVASCTLCHGDDQAATLIDTGSHAQHVNVAAKFGLTITCNRCHQDNGTNTAHFISAGVPNAAVQFGGTVITNQYQGEEMVPNTSYGTCSTNACHNNGKGGTVVIGAGGFAWGTPVASDCQFCHDDPPVSGRHQTHLGTTVSYGPYAGTASTNCNDCHDANNTLTMIGKTTHINGVVNFDDGNSVSTGGIVANATVTSCNICHGAQAATANVNAALAKAQWNTAARLTCESCHGDYALANSLANGGGIAAPSRAGAGYDNSGHGKTGVAKVCTDCHASTSAHISAATGDANRLQIVGGKDYAVDPNGFCNACHTTLTNSAAHYGNTQTAGGTSNDGLTCVTCHDGHGQNGGQAQMIASTIQGRAVSGFTDKTQRSSYGNAGFTGVCQVCHDPSEVNYFNRTTNALATHNSSGNCLQCHSHSSTPAFAASGCNGCHGDSAAGNYWPDGAVAADRAGEHQKHIEVLAARVYGQTTAQLLLAADTDVRQKALCEYCHAANTNDSNHAGTVNTADVFVDSDAVRHAKNLNGAADGNATYIPASQTCSNIDCHNSKLTTAAFSWYANPGPAASTDCMMCHTTGGGGANPTTGLHNVTNTGTVQEHNQNLGTGCSNCHTAPAYAPASTHINGTFNAESAVNNDRFLSASLNYTEAAVNQSTCAPSGPFAGCHADGGRWSRQWSTFADSVDTTPGNARCDVCHGWLNDWRSGLTVNHNLPKINDSTHADCEQCHVAFNAPYVFGTMHEDNLIQINNEATMQYNTTNGTCNVAVCHGATPTRGPGASTWLTESLLIGNGASCNACHDSRGGFSDVGRAGHTLHNSRAASGTADYGDTNVYSTDLGGYSFGCGNCHPTNANFATLHNNGVVNITLNSGHGGTIKSKNNVANDTAGYTQTNTTPKDGGAVTCTAAYCHSDAAGSFKTTPNWYAGTFTNPGGDYCQNCHGNQPTTGSHAKHAVGIHNDDIYSGTTGLISAGAASGGGHGDVATSITISCNMCHATTVTQWRNKLNTLCITCHSTDPAGDAIDRNDADLKKSLHVNGVKNVAFTAALPLRSKAQLRDDITAVPEINANWTRQGGYKSTSASHDLGPSLSGSWTSPNCTVACHNGNTIAWGTTATCSSCHTQLPK